MTRAGASQHRPASICIELPGKDSNLDEESQNPITPRRKSQAHKQLTPTVAAGCSAGCSGKRLEGGIGHAELTALVTSWPTLPEHIKAAIAALVGTVAPTPTKFLGSQTG